MIMRTTRNTFIRARALYNHIIISLLYGDTHYTTVTTTLRYIAVTAIYLSTYDKVVRTG